MRNDIRRYTSMKSNAQGHIFEQSIESCYVFGLCIKEKGEKQMRNTLADLNNILFEQMERLQDDDLKGENLETELKKTKSIVDVASTVIENASLSLEAQKFLIDMGISTKVNIPMLGISDKNEI